MLRERARFFGKLVVLTDFLLAFASYAFSRIILRARYNMPVGAMPFEARSMAVLISITFVCLYLNNVYGSIRRKTYSVIAKEVIAAHFQAATLAAILIFVFKLTYISRQLVLGYFLSSMFLITARRITMKFVLGSIRVKGYNLYNVLIVGTTRYGKLFARLLSDYNYLGYRVFGFLSTDGQDVGKPVRWTDNTVIGGFKDIDGILKNNPIDEVVFAVTDKDTSYLHEALLICEEYGVKMSILPAFFSLRFADMRIEEVGDTNLISFSTQRSAPMQRALKQVIDTLASAVLLIVSSPLMAAIAVAVKLDSEGPVFFVQERCGLNGRVFRFLKFRSMHKDAEEHKGELRGYNDMSGPIFKMRNDPRVTRVGKWLRKYSLDELPQLINVLKGDMSLVGPRPPVPSEVERYERWQRRRLSVKPGITCRWQVSGRNGIDFKDWMKLDLKYIDSWSLKQDIGLLLKTIPAVIKGSGM